MKELEDIIACEIAESGPLPFARFMELALYHPEYGYYCSEKEKLGVKGDFFTSCTLTPVFGRAIAVQLEEMWRRSGIVDFTVVEYGAGTGECCRSILEHFAAAENLPGTLRYVIIEISPSLKEKQRALLPRQVEWVDHISSVAGFSGAVFSNELLDNFPVHKITMEDRLMEIRVGYRNGRFAEVKIPADDDLERYFTQLRVTLPRGFVTEACLAVQPWMAGICASMKQGFVLTIDYGYLGGELFSDRFAQGSLVSYNAHRVVRDVYDDVGNQDITSHVNFSALALYGHDNGLLLSGFRDQAGFLSALGIKDLLAAARQELSPAALRSEDIILQTLLVDMGKKFKVLVMYKDLPQFQLRGFSVPEI